LITVDLVAQGDSEKENNDSLPNKPARADVLAVKQVAASSSASSLAIPSVHLLPCAIKHVGTAKVDCFFRPRVVFDDAKDSASSSSVAGGPKLTAAIRGRQITGHVVALGEDYTGLIVQQQGRPKSAHKSSAYSSKKPDAVTVGSEAENGLNWTVTQIFSSLGVWAPDELLHEREDLRSSLQEWSAISHAIHDSF